ncbi:MAG: dTDP-4-dehydrorhamnose 3,5-epimerase [Moraxellaceae bacterium]
MHCQPTRLPGVLLLTPEVYRDARGEFAEVFNAERFAACTGVAATFIQENQSRSAPGVLRGLHYQLAPAQGKLVRVAAGAVFDVAVDLRRHSPHFGQWTGAVLSADNACQQWIPPGFAHGFLVLGEAPAVVCYRVTAPYAPASERSLRFDDPALGIAWPATPRLLSARDRAALPLARAEVYP